MAGPKGPVHYRQQFVRCGKPGCRCAAEPTHGPYWYAVWREGERTRTRYVGKTLPPEAAATMAAHPSSSDTAAGVVASGAAPRKDRNDKGLLRPASAALPPPVRESRGAAQGSTTEVQRSLRIWTLGRFRVERDGLAVPDHAWRRQAAVTVLRLLLLADRRLLPREHIAAHLWPDARPEVARDHLAGAIHALRRALEPDLRAGAPSHYLVQEGPNLMLRLDQHDWVDYSAFEQALADAEAASDPFPHLEEAVALYGGDLFPDEPNVWCVAAREALRLRWHGALLALAEAQVAHRHISTAVSTLSRLLLCDPTNEEAARRLMSVLHRQGRRAEALRIYGRLVEALAEDLGAEPAPETEALAQALRAGAPLPRRRSSRPGDEAATLGPPPRDGAFPLVGRGHELSHIRDALLGARAGRGQTLLLTGDAGIGKTRLAEEAATVATMLGFTVLHGRAAEGERDLPYAPLADALRSYIHTRPAPALRRDLAGAEALSMILPELVALLPGLTQVPPLEHVDAERLRLWTAARALLSAAASSRAVLLILEDLQWMDDASLGLLTFLVRRGRDQRRLILGTVRESELAADHPVRRLLHEGRRDGTLDQVSLAGLSAEEVVVLARQRLGEPLTAAQVDLLHTQCGGNPLFAGELLALLHAHRQDVHARDAVAAVLSGVRPLPATIRQVLCQRLDRLGAACRALLQAGAVIGDHCSVDLLAHVVGQEQETFEVALDEAVAAGLLREDNAAPRGGYVMAHALLRRALYEQLLPMQRQRLHARVAERLAALAAAGHVADVAAIASHYAQTQDHVTAATWLERAGDHAAGVYAQVAALAHYTQARALLESSPAISRAIAEHRAALSRLAEKLGNLQLLAGDYAAAQEQFAQARALADATAARAELWRKEGVTWEQRGEYARALAALDAAEREGADHAQTGVWAAIRADVELSRGDVYRGRGEYEAAEAAALRALSVLQEEPECAARARAFHLVGHVAHMRGDFARAEDYYRHSLAVRERLEDRQGLAASWYGLGQLAYDRGDLPSAEEYHRRSLATREELGDQWGIAFSWGKLGLIAQYRGEYARAEDYHRQSLTIRERIGNQPGIAHAVYNLGQVARERGDYTEAERCYRRGLRIQERIGDQWGISNSLMDLGEVACERGHYAEAEAFFRQSLEIKAGMGDQLGITLLWHNLSIVMRERGDLATAATLARRARRLARRIGARGTEALAALGHAFSCLRAGRFRLARALIAHSRRLAATHGSAKLLVLAALAIADLYRLQGAPMDAEGAAYEALQLAIGGHFRREEALAQHLLGLCSMATGALGEAEEQLQDALMLFGEIGATVEEARTRVALADLLILRDGPSGDVDRLLAAARAIFVQAGAGRHLARLDGEAPGLRLRSGRR